MKRKQLLAALLCVATHLAHAETATSLDEVVVTATRFNSAPESSAVSVTVITAEDIKKSAAKTLPTLLAQRAGIQVRSNDGTQDMMVDLRGFGMTGNQNTLVLLDGQQLNDIELTTIRWSAIPLDSIERIEIVNGRDTGRSPGVRPAPVLAAMAPKNGKFPSVPVVSISGCM